MITDKEKRAPCCRFRKENAPSGSSDGDCFEQQETPVGNVAQVITQRMVTMIDTVSAVPIVLRVEYEHCATMTIYDTPAISLQANNTQAVSDMVTSIIEKKQRIIVCLEQGTVSWRKSISRAFVASHSPRKDKV
eukprot:TRINITY_DN1700_c0_g1_i1.p2 TRINITY_DN1700_c0_g1~~TRINITY_DN1700_c0_g1_i1.p2  ORF type:complete len:134 (+),score=18.96 TRINITY_DN1700_c0_g1_i1:265-666(+)